MPSLYITPARLNTVILVTCSILVALFFGLNLLFAPVVVIAMILEIKIISLNEKLSRYLPAFFISFPSSHILSPKETLWFGLAIIGSLISSVIITTILFLPYSALLLLEILQEAAYQKYGYFFLSVPSSIISVTIFLLLTRMIFSHDYRQSR